MLRNVVEALKKTKNFQSKQRYTNISHRVHVVCSSKQHKPLYNSQHVSLCGWVQQKQKEREDAGDEVWLVLEPNAGGWAYYRGQR